MLDPIDTLIVEDSADDAELAVRALRGAGLEPRPLRVETTEHLEQALRESTWDLVISDFSLPKMDAREALKLVRQVDPDVPFIIVSGTIGEERAVAAMRAGAQDYILKGEGLERLPPAVEREVREAANRRRRGAGCMRVVHERRQAQMSDALARVARGESVAGQETTGLRRDGTSIDLSVTISPIYDEGGRVIGASTVARDITDRKRVESRLAYLADHDLLTGLYNRRRFDEELTREIPLAQRSEQGGAAIVLGLDNFTLVNDTLGHHAGDELIRRVAGLLSEALDDVDIFARIGGDEFAILLREGPAEVVARELLDAVKEEPLVGGEQPVRVTASVGIAPLGGADLSAEELLMRADVAMHEAKDGSGDSVATFEPARHRRELMGERLQMVERIRSAIDAGSFSVYSQPILDVGADVISQHELLVRMLDEDGGVISPADFLPIAERFGLIVAIDRWMVLRAIELVAEQSERGRRICVEVNLSAGSMVDADLFNEIERAIQESAIDPAQLIFEVTETTAIENLGDAKRLAERLIQLGCRFALDDFGAGFGSFYYLKHLPFDFLKIDGDFIRRLPVNPTDQSMVEAIVQVCHQLGKRTIAEFVEDQATLDLLREYGVDFAQGYHIGRPMPAAEIFS